MSSPMSHAPPHELQHLRGNWCWFLTLGSLLIVVGMLAIGYPVAATLTTVEIFGYLLVIGGAVEIVSGIWGRNWGGFFLHLLSGMLYLFLGAFIIERPGLGAKGYTFILAVFFVALGASRLCFALSHKFDGRIWSILSGVITLALGIMIWRELPESAFWVIGTFVGIELIFNGCTWVMLGLAAKSIPAGGHPGATH